MQPRSIYSKIRESAPLLLFTVPLLYFWIYSLWIQPSENYYVNDAVFPYFANSLAVFHGGTYRYVDHPGTPVELIGSALIGLTAPFLSNSAHGLVYYHLQHPELFFNMASYLLVSLNIGCMLIFFLIARTSNNFAHTTLSISLAVMYFAIHSGSLGTGMIWNHNSFSYPFGTLLSLYLFNNLQKASLADGRLPIATLIWLGFWSGVLASITIYLLAWLAGILTAIGLYYLLKRVPFLKIAAALSIVTASSVFGFLLSTLPVIRILPTFITWAVRILLHKSSYLAVPEDETTLTRIYHNSVSLFNSLPALYIATIVVFALGIIALFLWGRKAAEKAGTWAAIGGLFAQSAILVFILLDRPSRDAYYLSLSATLPVLLLSILKIYESKIEVYKALALAISGLILLGVINTTLTGLSIHRMEVESLAESRRVVAETISGYSQANKRDPRDMVILWMHNADSTCWGLRLGNLKAGKIFDSDLDILCQNQYQLNNNLRAILTDHSYRLNEFEWDIIFTCDRWVKRLTEADPSLIVQDQTGVRWSCGNMVIVYNPRIRQPQ